MWFFWVWVLLGRSVPSLAEANLTPCTPAGALPGWQVQLGECQLWRAGVGGRYAAVLSTAVRYPHGNRQKWCRIQIRGI